MKTQEATKGRLPLVLKSTLPLSTNVAAEPLMDLTTTTLVSTPANV